MKIRIVSELAVLREAVAGSLRAGGWEAEAIQGRAPSFYLAYPTALAVATLEDLIDLLAPFAPELRPTGELGGVDAALFLGPAEAFRGCRLGVEANGVDPLGRIMGPLVAETGLAVLPPGFTDETAGAVRFGGAPPFAWQTVAWVAAKAGFSLTPQKTFPDEDLEIRVRLVDAALVDAPLRERFGVRIDTDDLVQGNELREWLEDDGFRAVRVQLLDEASETNRRFSLSPGPFGEDTTDPGLPVLVDRCRAYVAACGVDPAGFPFQVREGEDQVGLEARVTLPFRALEEGRFAPYEGPYPERFRFVIRTDDKARAVGFVEALEARGFVNVGPARSIGRRRDFKKGFQVEWGCAARFPEIADEILAAVRAEMARLGCDERFTVSARETFGADDTRVRVYLPVAAALDGSLWEHLPKPGDYSLRLYTPTPDGWSPLLDELRSGGFSVGTPRQEAVDTAKVSYGGAPDPILDKLQQIVKGRWGEEIQATKAWGDDDRDLWLYLPSAPAPSKAAPPVRREERLATEILALGRGVAAHRGATLMGPTEVLIGALLSGEGRALVAETVEVEVEQAPTLQALGGRFAELSTAEIGPEERRLPLTQGLKQALRTLRDRYGKLKAGPLVRWVLDAVADDDWGREFFAAIAGLRRARHLGKLNRLREALDRVAELREVLSDRVLGQERVIERVCDAYLQVFSGPPRAEGRRGPRALFTFVGPPGVGKTHLAEVLARHLGEGAGIALLRLDMSGYSGPQNHEALLGASEFYKGAKGGVLTRFVAENPAGFILFDEMEKAHANTQDLLLQILDAGTLFDAHTSKNVDFSGCTVIVTTNLGRSLYDSPNRAGVFQGSQDLDALVIQALGEEGGRDQGFTAEFLSRLAKGTAVLFERLDGLALERIATQTLERVANEIKEETGLTLASVEPLLTSLFILHFGAGGDARRMDGALAKYLRDCVGLAVRAHPQILSPRDGDDPCYGFRFVLGEGERIPEDILSHLEGDTRVLLIDDDPWSSLFEAPYRCTQVGSRDEADRVLTGGGADLVLLDLHLGSPPEEDRRDEGLTLLSWLRERYPALPVYLFSEQPEKRGLSPELLERVRIEGGARGVLQKQFFGTDEESLLEKTSFFRQLAEADAARRRQGLVESYQRRARVVEFDVAARPEARDAEGVIPLEIRRVRETTAVSAMDRDMQGWVSLPDDRLEGIKGAEGAKKRLEEVVRWLGDPGLLRRFGLRIPRGILLTGPPGTGKTSLARAVAGEAGVPFFAIAGSDPGGQADQPPEQYLRDLFACARRYAPAVIFIDEIDSLGRKREEGVRAGALNELLSQLDGFQRGDRPLFVLAATNRVDVLDPALVRPGRFDITIEVGVPGPGSRVALFGQYLGDKPLAEDVVLDVLLKELAARTAGMSGAQIEQVCLEAAMQALRDHHKDPTKQGVTQMHLQEAINTVRFGIAAETPVLAAGLRRATAVHEAGHAVVQHELLPDQPITQVTILPRGRVMGFVESGRTGLADTTPDDVRRQLMVRLAGRTAEELLLGDGQITNGCSDDLEKATALAARAVSEWGFDADTGIVSLDGVRVGLGARKGSGESTRALEEEMTGRIRTWLSDAQQQCRKLLEKRRGRLEKLAETLEDRETIYRDELDWVLSSVGEE